jgi:homoserine kinase
MRSIRAYAPASIGNFAAGFDVVGAALAPLDGKLLGDVVELRESSACTLDVTGPFAFQLADVADNLVLRTHGLFRAAVEQEGGRCPDYAFRLEKNLPVNSGLGSSASSIVATLVGLQAALGEPLGWPEVLELAGRAEGLFSGGIHLDNVAPSLSGGLQLVVPGRREKQAFATRGLPWFEDLVVAVVHPDFELPTAKSRAALPATVPVEATVAWGRNLAALVHALHIRDRGLFSLVLRDLLAEPHRAGLVPGFTAAKTAAVAAGAWGCSFSGSGPSVFAVVDEHHAEAVLAALRRGFQEAGMDSRGWLCGLDTLGARVL